MREIIRKNINQKICFQFWASFIGFYFNSLDWIFQISIKFENKIIFFTQQPWHNHHIFTKIFSFSLYWIFQIFIMILCVALWHITCSIMVMSYQICYAKDSFIIWSHILDFYQSFWTWIRDTSTLPYWSLNNFFFFLLILIIYLFFFYFLFFYFFFVEEVLLD